MRNPLRNRTRRGFIAAAVLLGLIVLAMLMGLLIRSALIRRTETARAERRLQAETLARSGLERAAARLATNPGYDGETWEITADSLGKRDSGLVRIAVEKIDGQPDRRRVTSRADYPGRPESRSRVTRTRIVELKRTN